MNDVVFERGIVYIASHSQAQTVGLDRDEDCFLIVLVISAFAVIISLKHLPLFVLRV